MADDEHQIERHLTPNGWVEGNEWVNRCLIKNVETPSDRVETWIETRSDSSEGWAPPTVSSKKTWESSDVLPEEREKLHQKSPRPEFKPWRQPPRRKRRRVID